MESFDVTKVAAALESNRALQTTIRAELRRVQEAKALNRRQAASVTDRITRQTVLEATKRDGRSFHPSDWHPRFFSDTSGRAPALYENGSKDDFFRQFRPPWNIKESKVLVKTVKSAIEVGFPPEERYQRVASALKMPKHGFRRTPEECKVEFQRQCEKPLTKDEQNRLMVAVDESTAEDGVDWTLIAQTLSENRLVPCSSFQCLAAYNKANQGKTKKRKSLATWTPEEDNLLLKFMLVAGPQLMLDSKHPFVHFTFPKLFPEKTKKQILDRIHGSSLNPKLAEGEWTDFEERKLTVLMKIYGGDVVLASKHMNRALKAVSDKWQRTLNPEYSTGPFSKEEDAKLVAIIRSQPQLGWRDISRDHFPDRHPQRLMNRWSDLATDDDIIAREQNSRKRSKRQKTKRFKSCLQPSARQDC